MTPFDRIAGPVRDLAEGDILFRQGDEAVAIYQIERGAVRLERQTVDGRRVVVHAARAGERLAEASLFAPAYHCDAIAVRASRVRAIPKAAALRALRDDPRAAEAFMAELARQLQRLRQGLEIRNVRSAQERTLLQLGLMAGSDGRVLLATPLQDVAAEIGLSRETLYRALAALERAGRIAREPGAIRLAGPSAL